MIRTGSRLALGVTLFIAAWGAVAAQEPAASTMPAAPAPTAAGSTAAVSEREAPDPRPRSRLRSLGDQPLDAASGAYQLTVTCNTASFQGYVGPRLAGPRSYDADNPGLRSFSGTQNRIGRLAPGSYTVTVRQDGYREIDVDLEIVPGRQYALDVELVAASGQLAVSGDQPLQDLTVDGAAAAPGQAVELAEGRHLVAARSFGFADYRSSIYVARDRLVTLDVHFAPADFALSRAAWSRAAFRPGNPGSLGASRFGFAVNAPGSAELRISDRGGATRRTWRWNDFRQWSQGWVWDGTDEAGQALPAGEYDWELRAAPANPGGGSASTVRGAIAIDYAAFAKYRGHAAGAAGLDFCADAYTLPALGLQVGLRAAYRYDQAAGAGGHHAQAGFEGGLGIVGNLDLWFAGVADFELAQGGSRVSQLGGGLGWACLPLPAVVPGQADRLDFGLKVNVSGAGLLYPAVGRPFDFDQAGLPPGGRLGLALQLRYGVFSFLLEPALHASAWPVHLDGAAAAGDPPAGSFVAYASYRAGAYLDFDRALVGVSAALYTKPDFSPQAPLRIGLQAQFAVADAMTLGIDAQAKPDGAAWSPAFGLSFGFMQ